MPAVEAAPRQKRQRRRDSESTPNHPLPNFRSFQLCTLTAEVPKGDGWIFEMKFDGYRTQDAISGSQVRVYTRNGHDWTDKFSTILEPLRRLTKGSALIDGEIVAIDQKGRTNFSMLKTSIGAGRPLKFFAFDIFDIDGADLSDAPLIERKERLSDLLGERPPEDALQFSGHVTDGKTLFRSMCEGGHEGVIAKRAEGKYVGDRTTSWLKIKCTKRQEFVIGGWRPSDTGRGMASLLLGTYEDGKFVYRRSRWHRFHRGNAQQDPRPELLAEIAYAEITPDGSVRHASFQGLRSDKAASQVILEMPVKTSATEPLDPGMGKEIANALGIKLSHPDKVMYPSTAITKAHLAAYYAVVADRMLPYIVGRPLSLVRDTNNDLTKTFFQKHQLPGMPKAIRAGEMQKLSGKDARILWIEDLAGLIAGVQMNTLEFHVWGSDRHKPDLPHRMVFDIDPYEGLSIEDVKQAATDIRDVLGVLGLKSWPLVSGGKGIHVVVPLLPKANWDEVKDFCQAFAELMARTDPHRFVANMSKARRKGRVFLDYLHNGQGATAISPWSTRARLGGTVAVPVMWSELDHLDRANGFDIAAAARAKQ